MSEQQQWYVTIAGSAVGPVSTDLVLRGIRHKKIATEAYVCVVGASEWQALSDVPEFLGALREHGLVQDDRVAQSASDTMNDPSETQALSDVAEDDETEATSPFSSRPPADVSASAHTTSESPLFARAQDSDSVMDPGHGLVSDSTMSGAVEQESPVLRSRPTHDVPIHEVTQDANADVSRSPMQSIDVEIDVAVEELAPVTSGVDWNHGFAEYFLVDANITLPDEEVLLRSLTTEAHETFLHDEAMWNLALCLAFGSNAVASIAADVFFDVVTAHQQHDRIEWVVRTLLSRGFMPSGIPHSNGNQAIGRLRQTCPDELRMQLETQISA